MRKQFSFILKFTKTANLFKKKLCFFLFLHSITFSFLRVVATEKWKVKTKSEKKKKKKFLVLFLKFIFGICQNILWLLTLIFKGVVANLKFIGSCKRRGQQVLQIRRHICNSLLQLECCCPRPMTLP